MHLIFNSLLFTFSLLPITILAHTTFHLDIPLFLDVPPSLSFLTTKAQLLINEYISELNLSIPYTVTFLETPTPSSYVIRLGFSDHESFFIDPQGRSALVFQTDALIIHGEMAVFIKDVVVRHILDCELNMWSQNFVNDGVGAVLDRNMNVMIRVMSDVRFLNWEQSLFEDVFDPLLYEVERLTTLKVDFEMEKVDDFIEFNIDKLKWDHERLMFYVVLTQDDDEIPSIVVPQKGAVLSRRILHPLTQMDQIEVIETLAGQILKVLGLPQCEPKSPFIRLDFMVRRQLYKNFISLQQEYKAPVLELIDDYDFDSALQLSWDLLKITKTANITLHDRTSHDNNNE
ncbi:hypothetical protein BON22_3362 [Cyberlindnera fabianii]|uniref:Uncharacterized protein n=1 Tax=Cyberlindnera fabianii TaxID=36022 RepID=A0A1V2L473_CYBFA|nr:hypothetical protein BON22_3362 [Cyberlindnera fabianii]